MDLPHTPERLSLRLFDGNSAINIISHVPTLLRTLRPQLASIESIVRNVQRAALDYVLHSELPPALRSRARRICATASSCPTGDSHRSGGVATADFSAALATPAAEKRWTGYREA